MVDGVPVGRLERPDSPEELAATLREAAARGEAVIPIGGGRALGLGDPPQRADLGLETRGLHRIIELSQPDMTVSVEAGITVEEVDRALAEVGQFLPIDPFNSPGHTIGGVLAAGLSGPLRLRYGSPRDFVIGMRVALPDGRLVSSGGRVVKNVSGYDMNKLHQGALGSLGVIVAASFKTYPRPLHELTVEIRSEDPWTEVRRALALKQPPVALELSSDGRVWGRFTGTERGVARMAAELGWPAADGAGWTEHGRRGADTWVRLSVPPERLQEVLGTLPAGAGWWASPGVGTAHWISAVDERTLTDTRAAVEAAGGSAVLMAAPPALKRQVSAWGRPPATLDWMRRLKDAFDPGHCLSPGRFVV